MRIIFLWRIKLKQILLFILLLSTAAISLFFGRADKPQLTDVPVYVVDAQLMRLIPVSEPVIEGDSEFMAKQVVRRLIRGHDKNRKIRRLVPENGGCMSIKVRDKVANINIKSKYFKDCLTSRDIEKLCVYQIVNSVTEIEGIEAVKFTIDGRSTKKLAGYIDMRDLFVPDYLV